MSIRANLTLAINYRVNYVRIEENLFFGMIINYGIKNAFSAGIFEIRIPWGINEDKKQA